MTLVKYHYNNPMDSFLNTLLNMENEDVNQDQCMIPKANIMEEVGKYVMQIALPGFDKKHITMKMEDDELIVKAEQEDQDKAYHMREFGAARMERSFDLPEEIDDEKISASFKNGILTIELPLKKEVNQKKEIAIA